MAAARPNQISGSPPDPSAVERGMYLFPFIRLAREPAKVLPQNRRSLSSIPGDLMSDLGYAVSSSAVGAGSTMAASTTAAWRPKFLPLRLSRFRLANQRTGFFAVRCLRRFARCMAWRESLRLRRATNCAPASWLLPIHVIRSEADRARAVLSTLAGWTSSKIAEAFGVREETASPVAQRLHRRRCRSAEDQHRARPDSGEE